MGGDRGARDVGSALASAASRPVRAAEGWLRRSFTRKFVVLMLVALVCASLVGVATYTVATDRLDEQVHRDVTSTAKLQAHALHNWIESKRQETRAISAAPAFQSGVRTDISFELVKEASAMPPDVVAIHYLNLDTGRVVESTDRSLVGENASANGWAVVPPANRETLTTTSRVAVSRPYTSPTSGRRAVAFVSSPPRNTRYAVVVVGNLSMQAHSLYQTYRSSYSRVLTDGGGVVVSTGASRRDRQIDVASLTGNASGFASTPEMVAGYAAVPGVGWTVSDRVPASAAYALRDVVGWVLVATVLGMLVTIALAAVLFGRRTNRTLTQLTEQAEAVADGELGRRIESERRDELGRLAGSFEAMRRSLQRSLTEEAAARRAAERERRAASERSERLAGHADDFGHVMAACADGDLDQRIETPASDGPMHRIATAFNEMMDDVQGKTERLETFSRVLSHDIRNPLTVASGRADLIAANRETEHTEQLVQSLDRIDTILEDAQVIARTSNHVETEPLDVGAVAERAWCHVETRAATLTVADEPTVTANPDLLCQAFENLFRNAIEHAGPAVTVTVGAAERGFYVADDGPGIPPGERDQIFETGFTTNAADGGTGFGLTVVSAVADVHGWSIAATDGEAAGATFVVETAPAPELGVDGERSQRNRSDA